MKSIAEELIAESDIVLPFFNKIKNLVRFAHNWNDGTMEYWNIGSFLHRIEKHYAS